MEDCVIDLSHFNQVNDFAKVKAAGIRAVIHKATQGHAVVDATYAARRTQAQTAGLLWGAYHFGTGWDGVEQADWFLSKVGSPAPSILVLEFEQNTAGPSMTLAQAHAFVTHIQAKTGRWPGLYAGSYLKEQLKSAKDPVLANCWFWLAQYSATPVIPKAWLRWTLWQYTETGAVPGIGGQVDRDRFNGSADELAAFWKQGGKGAGAAPAAPKPAQPAKG